MLKDKFISILNELNESSSGIEASALISIDGLMIASSLSTNMDESWVGAMSAAFLSLGERAGKELARGTIDRILVQGDKGFVIMTSSGKEAILTVLAKPNVNVGLAFHEIKRSAEALAHLIHS